MEVTIYLNEMRLNLNCLGWMCSMLRLLTWCVWGSGFNHQHCKTNNYNKKYISKISRMHAIDKKLNMSTYYDIMWTVNILLTIIYLLPVITLIYISIIFQPLPEARDLDTIKYMIQYIKMLFGPRDSRKGVQEAPDTSFPFYGFLIWDLAFESTALAIQSCQSMSRVLVIGIKYLTKSICDLPPKLLPTLKNILNHKLQIL